ncbi:MAG: 1-acyl-sn-glycerol-3-phosphate acyltransferase [Deltaproteobacteria bacterium]|nr:1-acyl-sn-glycerol-3-phosphate acyltransferase [Deltaproteobacteria bacterium]NND28905.1 1-acyl-sn-glycerol-3-phosphate acyltransferase [Myxococcales bacterium]MBT8464080.1 1-acyl-sn-glycerol-3-phosphate acyltransferase [Deltaproteobacteria bacterium]MBT8483324.1 1-acyl-sn-glycerol-3-phosphate acyltransferase [Deltaproteobacteria bacterium]NNK05941.1 1-acyl-sn-glycerol-3-phosphate acyltransferase [Myxococcales bacterium]
MGLKNTVDWARTEWGIFRKGGEMGWGQRGRWLRQWVPFGARTVGWATLSLTTGPLTNGKGSTWAAKNWSRSSAKGLRIYIEATGQQNLPEGGFVYASNHESLVDILVLGAALPGDFKWAAKRTVMNVPFLGWHLRLAGHVPVDRNKGKDAAMAVTEAFESVLRNDKPLLVFPEGTRTADGKLKAFKNGAFQAAVLTGKPVVPVAIRGTFSLMSRDEVDTGGSRSRDDRLVTVQIGKPLYPNLELEEPDAVAELRDRARSAVVQMLTEAASTQAVAESARPL